TARRNPTGGLSSTPNITIVSGKPVTILNGNQQVLVDRDAVTSGAAATGEPWQHYDLGHGYCTYTFFEQCPHRMACARCDFYTPKDSSKAQLLEAKGNLQKMRALIPLSEDE
ncbi:hypothetical protein ACIRVM_46685, partial [Streptomyces chartreusis]